MALYLNLSCDSDVLAPASQPLAADHSDDDDDVVENDVDAPAVSDDVSPADDEDMIPDTPPPPTPPRRVMRLLRPRRNKPPPSTPAKGLCASPATKSSPPPAPRKRRLFADHGVEAVSPASPPRSFDFYRVPPSGRPAQHMPDEEDDVSARQQPPEIVRASRRWSTLAGLRTRIAPEFWGPPPPASPVSSEVEIRLSPPLVSQEDAWGWHQGTVERTYDPSTPPLVRCNVSHVSLRAASLEDVRPRSGEPGSAPGEPGTVAAVMCGHPQALYDVLVGADMGDGWRECYWIPARPHRSSVKLLPASTALRRIGELYTSGTQPREAVQVHLSMLREVNCPRFYLVVPVPSAIAEFSIFLRGAIIKRRGIVTLQREEHPVSLGTLVRAAAVEQFRK